MCFFALHYFCFAQVNFQHDSFTLSKDDTCASISFQATRKHEFLISCLMFLWSSLQQVTRLFIWRLATWCSTSADLLSIFIVKTSTICYARAFVKFEDAFMEMLKFNRHDAICQWVFACDNMKTHYSLWDNSACNSCNQDGALFCTVCRFTAFQRWTYECLRYSKQTKSINQSDYESTLKSSRC